MPSSRSSSGQGSLNLVDVTLRDAGGACMRALPEHRPHGQRPLVRRLWRRSAWWRDLDVTASNLTVGAGAESGMHLSGVRGSVGSVDASAHDGPGASMHLEDIDEDLRLVDLMVAGQGTAALTGGPNRALNLEGVHISGAPGLTWTIPQACSKTWCSMDPARARPSSPIGRSTPLEVHGLTISGYALGLDAHADSNEDLHRCVCMGLRFRRTWWPPTAILWTSTMRCSRAASTRRYHREGGGWLFDSDQTTVLGDGVLERDDPAFGRRT